MPGVHITIVKEEDCMFAVYDSQSISDVPSLCYLCNSIVHVVFGARSSLRQVRTMRYICVHNHKHLNTFDSPSTTASQLFLEDKGNVIVDECDVLRSYFRQYNWELRKRQQAIQKMADAVDGASSSPR